MVRAEAASTRLGNAMEMDMHIGGGALLWWQRLPAAVRSPVWPGILSALIILGMLLTFHQVVRGVVQQSELRHQATAQRAEATWRCRALPGLQASRTCLLKLDATTHGDAMLQAWNTTAP